MQKLNCLGNIQYDEKENYAVFSINPKIYPLDVIHLAAYVCIDRMFIMLDGDPDSEIKVEIRKKENSHDMKKLVSDFNDELLNYSVYKQQSEKSRIIRETILQRVLLTNSPDYLDMLVKRQIEDDRPVEDKEGIMKTWEEANLGETPDSDEILVKSDEGKDAEG